MSGKPTINPIKQATDALNQSGKNVTEGLNGIGTNQGNIREQLENSINVGKTTPKTTNRPSSPTSVVDIDTEKFKAEYAKTTTKEMDCYQVLMVDKNAKQEEIQQAYEELKANFKGDNRYKEVGSQIKLAYKILSNEETRTAYDSHLSKQENSINQDNRKRTNSEPTINDSSLDNNEKNRVRSQSNDAPKDLNSVSELRKKFEANKSSGPSSTPLTSGTGSRIR